MEIIKALFLGLLQGLTEFLPVSSSGHLVIAQSYLNFEATPLLFNCLLHFGTTLAVIFVYRGQILRILSALSETPAAYKKGGSSPKIWLAHPERKLALLIVVSSIPTALIGLAGKDFFTALFVLPKTAAAMLLVTGIILYAGENFSKERKGKRVGFLEAILMGTAQGIAIIPGISRSGITIVTGLFCGLKRGEAASFSFLFSIPAILGASILEFGEALSCNTPCNWPAYLGGTLVSFLTGVIVIKTFLFLLKKHKLSYFAYYCFALGGVVLFTTI